LQLRDEASTQRSKAMKQRLAARCDTFARSKSVGIWITDDVLDEALRRFTRVHQRYGSSVPGPLEARRREAKRRNGGLARHGPSAPFDHAAIFSKHTGFGWWDAPAQSLPQSGAVPFQLDFFQPMWSLTPLTPPPIPGPQASTLPQNKSALIGFNESDYLAPARQQMDEPPSPPPLPHGVPYSQLSAPAPRHDSPSAFYASLDCGAAGRAINTSDQLQAPHIPDSQASTFFLIPEALDNLEQSEDLTPATRQEGTPEQIPKPRFQENLARCLSLQDLRSLIHKHGPLREADRIKSLAVYKQAMSQIQNWSCQDLADYLSDPVFHVPGSAIAVRFVRSHTLSKELNFDHSQWSILVPAIAKSVALGFLSTQEWTELLIEFFVLRARFTSRGDNSPSPAAHAEVLLRAFDQCPVLSRRDLDPDFLLKHTAKLLSHQFDEENLQILRLVQRWLDQEHHCPVAEALVTRALMSPWKGVAIRSAARALSSLPTHMLVRVINQASKTLVATALPERDKTAGLANLADMLQELAQLDDGPELRAEDWNALMSTSSRGGTGLTASEGAVVNIWVLHHLFAPSRTANKASSAINTQKLRARNLHRYLRKFFGHPKEETPGAIAARFAIVLHTLPLPGKNVLLADLKRVTNHTSYPWHRRRLRVKHGLLLNGDLALMTDDQTYGFVRKYMRGALATTCSGLTLDFNAFGALARALILEDADSAVLVARVLRHSHDLRSILWRSQEAKRDGLASRPNRTAEARDNVVHPMQPDSTLSRTERKALNLVNMLAVTYAVSRRISDKQAVENVQWCYNFLQQLSAPIEPPISQALWHVSVVRQRYCSPEYRRWLLHVVKSVEGAQTANLLATRPGFASHRTQSFQALVRLYDQQASLQVSSDAISQRSKTIQRRIRHYRAEREQAFATARARSAPLDTVPADSWETHIEWRKAFRGFFNELKPLPSNSNLTDAAPKPSKRVGHVDIRKQSAEREYVEGISSKSVAQQAQISGDEPSIDIWVTKEITEERVAAFGT
jgi:hypothetical protein